MSGFYTCKCCGKSAYKSEQDYFSSIGLCNSCGFTLASAPYNDPELFKRLFNKDLNVHRFFGRCSHCGSTAEFKNSKQEIIIRNFCEECYRNYLIPNSKLIQSWKKLKNL